MLQSTLSKKFRGCMIGALLGDCFGAPYEYESIKNPISVSQLQSYFDKLEGPPYKSKSRSSARRFNDFKFLNLL